MPSQPKIETAEQREARLARQHAYMDRKRAKDPEATRIAQNEAARRYRSKYPERAKASNKAWRSTHMDRFNLQRRLWRSRNMVRALFLEARHRAKKRGIEFTIVLEDIPPIGDVCPLLGHPFHIPAEHELRGRSPYAPSLDRKDPAKGYIKGNVWIVGYRANLVKNDGTAEEHEMIARAMRRGVK